MKRSSLVGTLVWALCALPLAAQSITVTHPGTGEVCTKGQPCAIAWTISGPGGGSQPGGTAVIELMDKEAPTVRKTISPGVPIGNLQFSWTVPGDVVAGQYRVQVRLQGALLSDIGDPFTIKAQSGGFHPSAGAAAKATVPAGVGAHGATAVMPIRIVSPETGSMWEAAKSYFIRWTADTKPDDGFTVELCNAGGTKLWTIQDGLSAQRQPDGTWFIPVSLPCGRPACAGDYRVRVTSLYLKKSALSGVFTIASKTRKIIKSVPITVENALLSQTNIAAANYNGYCCGMTDPAGRARVGSMVSHAAGMDHFEAHFMRSRLRCDLSAFANKKGEVESAKLLFGDHQKCAGCSGGSPLPFCASRVFALAGADSNRWNTFGPQPATGTYQVYALTGWSAAANWAAGVDVKVPVAEWLKGAKPNLGFVVTASSEMYACPSMDDCKWECVSFFHPILYVTFIEDVCGCEAQ